MQNRRRLVVAIRARPGYRNGMHTAGLQAGLQSGPPSQVCGLVVRRGGLSPAEPGEPAGGSRCAWRRRSRRAGAPAKVGAAGSGAVAGRCREGAEAIADPPRDLERGVKQRKSFASSALAHLDMQTAGLERHGGAVRRRGVPFWAC